VSDRVEIEVELPREKLAPHMARNALRRACADRIETEVLVDAELLVSELATNALLHGRGNIKLRAAIDERRVWAAVIDEGGGFDESLRRRACDQIGGWGLDLVDVLSSRWGVENSSQVWFELRRPARSR
jgi:anti-sigma regulatory factor (Ser/Thr protein kinase)